MIRPVDRKLALLLVRLRMWSLVVEMRCVRVRPKRGTRWLWRWMRRRQAQEPYPYHHAPCCPANRWSRQELVLQRCNCGAVKHHVVSKIA